MQRTHHVPLLALVLLLMFSGTGCSVYNDLVRLEENVNQAWADVESQYQRRADLVPNLVSTVRGAAAFERETLEAVINARARATSIQLSTEDLENPERVAQFQAAQQELGSALGRLLFVAEQYPQLQAVESFRDLQVQLEGTENRISVSRMRYNESVSQFNRRVRQFPSMLVASMTGFKTRTPFQADPGAERAPAVDFS